MLAPRLTEAQHNSRQTAIDSIIDEIMIDTPRFAALMNEPRIPTALIEQIKVADTSYGDDKIAAALGRALMVWARDVLIPVAEAQLKREIDSQIEYRGWLRSGDL